MLLLLPSQVAVVLAVSLTCFFFARQYRRFMVRSRDSLLQKPVDLLMALDGDGDGDSS